MREELCESIKTDITLGGEELLVATLCLAVIHDDPSSELEIFNNGFFS